MVEVRRSTIIDAPIEQVWAIIGDFGAHDRWHPGVVASRMEPGVSAGAVGAVRNLTLADGVKVREQLLSYSENRHAFSYCMLDCSLPLIGYIANVTLKPVTDGNRTFGPAPFWWTVRDFRL